jgi:hypothetical protein
MWHGFGVAKGKDGKSYSIFGPMQSIICAPLVSAANYINKSRWYESPVVTVPTSHYLNDSIWRYMAHERPKDIKPHACRFLVSFFNSFVTILQVIVLWFLIRRITRSSVSAWLTSALYALGTLAWPYAGTFFSEPLATLFALSSFYLLVISNVRFDGKPVYTWLILSGLSLGASAATHITGALFIPFWCAIAWNVCCKSKLDRKKALKLVAAFGWGLFAALLLLGYYNYARFGSFLETGRSVNPNDIARFGYGHFVAPWQGLYELMFGCWKGLLLFCPAVALGLFTWKSLHRQNTFISWTILTAAVFRLLFIAARSDWHGGFCLGPRYLVMIIPFLIIPVGCYINEQMISGNKAKLFMMAGLIWACAIQQLYFSIGEIFLHYHHIRLIITGANLPEHFIYTDFSVSPLYRLFGGQKSPWLLQHAPLSNVTLWLICTLLLGIALLLSFRWLSSESKNLQHTSEELNCPKVAA